MRLSVTFRPQKTLHLPLNYQYVLQGFLYRSLTSPHFADFLHEVGFQKGNRTFKLFTFSRLSGMHRILIKQKKIEFTDTVTWHVSSVLETLIQQLAEYLMFSETIQLHGQVLTVEKLEIQRTKFEKNTCKIEMLSPVTVYSTYEKEDRKKTHYFQPLDPVFPVLIESNFENKYEAYHGKRPEHPFLIKPLQILDKYKVVTTFKGHIITGWLGKFEIQSSPEQLAFAYDTGIGGRNSQGFGMFEVID
ncbi:CRISPR-associated endoribonuclease Cas6 [Ectobacillus sp. JY-23]|uniref:CRISPR-associated endoribonuclease Cas6 n=1 Tax=Ectobacillus sp. JY-23 TaxID=2933872 RepID=UPI001FF58917|nr:CRISPR-associated endoribonuclease Cas6 [Ectobacillus sp. JY-23]UOY94249.1 CRISPR-associated endoribonuclease Cas6 [Ectobacillus sp. JY-23]